MRTIVSSKIIRALEIIRVKNLILEDSHLLKFYEINIYQVMIFSLYTVYNKQEMIKTDNLIREKTQELLQVLE